MKEMMLAVWGYRYFILSSIKTEMHSRFARSKIGGVWMVLHPLAQVLVYALILSKIMAGKLPGVESQYAYPIYIVSGVVGWTLFSDILSRSATVFIDNGNLLKKMAFPKLALPLITIGSALVNFFFLSVVMIVVFGFLGHLPFHAIYWMPVLVFITLSLAIGLGLFLGTLNVFIRDVGQILSVVLQFWFWLTPVVYMATIVPEKFRWLLMWNPMTGIIMGYQNVLVYDVAPKLDLLIYPSVVACMSLILAFITFRKASEEMVDVL